MNRCIVYLPENVLPYLLGLRKWEEAIVSDHEETVAMV